MTIVTCPHCGARNRVNEGAALTLRPICGQCGARLEVSVPATETKPVIVTDATFADAVLQHGGSRPVLLDCWAAWCGPCRMIAPALDELAAESAGRYRIAKLNVDENPRTAAQFGIQSIPTLLIFKDSQLVERIVGAHPKQAIAARLAAHL